MTADDLRLRQLTEVLAERDRLRAALSDLLRQVESRKNGATFNRDLARAALTQDKE